jgi:NAD(P)H-dependent FMN reductase
MVKLQIILGSTRPGRAGEAVAHWVHKIARERKDFEVELVDVADYDLPLLDEPAPPMLNQYTKDHTRKWSEKIAQADGYIIVTGEYNHSIPGALKNAIDYLNVEWRDKAVGFVSYGSSAGGSRAVEHLRGVAAELHLADVRDQLALYLATDFEHFHDYVPSPQREKQLHVVLDQTVRWAKALQPLRQPNPVV